MKISLHKRLNLYRLFFSLLVLGVVFYAGIYYHSRTNKPDLHRLYMQSMEIEDQPPVVFVHGVMGSKLRNRVTGEELWPGSLGRILFSNYTDVALDIDPDTLAPVPVTSRHLK